MTARIVLSIALVVAVGVLALIVILSIQDHRPSSRSDHWVTLPDIPFTEREFDAGDVTWSSVGQSGIPWFIVLGLDGNEIDHTYRQLSNVTIRSERGGEFTIDAADVVWPSATLTANEYTLYDFNGALITQVQFDTRASIGGDFTIRWNSSGVMRVSS